MRSATLLIASLAFTAVLGSPSTCKRERPTQEFDYVVVGGGTAGLAVASRLGEKLPQARIVVLEAGPDARADPRITIPGYRGRPFNTALDWNLTTTPQPGLNGRSVAHPRGRVLGGSSALNLMTWDRASKEEFDIWEQLGNPGWNWESMIEAMLAAETFNTTSGEDVGPMSSQRRYDISDEGMGTDGPVNTWINDVIPVQQFDFIPTMNALGIPENLKSLAGTPLGVMYQPSNIDRSTLQRSYSTDYLSLGGSNRTNVYIRPDSRVSNINLDGNRATGVTLVNGDVINAVKEVILSAGSLQSPQLLELSGIGKESVLSAVGIEQKVALDSVGENLQDHLRIQNAYEVKSNYTTYDILRFNTTRAAQEQALYDAGQPSLYLYTGSGYSFLTWDQALGTGPENNLKSLANQVHDPANLIDRTKLTYYEDSALNAAVPQVEIIFSDGYTGARAYPAASSPDYGKQFFTLIASVMHPFARGSVHINSSSIADRPLINPNYLSNAYDVAAATAASQYLRKIANTYPIRQIWQAEYDPGQNVQTDEQWEAWIRNNTGTIFHPVGTCAMLPQEDGGVVNSRLQVYGVESLRVVDASIIPMILSAHIQTAVYGIAERAAGIIAEDAAAAAKRS